MALECASGYGLHGPRRILCRRVRGEKVVMEDVANAVGVEFVKYCALYVVLVSLLQLLWDRLVK